MNERFSTFLECSQNQVCYSSGKNKDPIHPSFWLYKSLVGGTAIWSCNFWWTAKSTSPPWIWNGRLPPVFLIEHLTTIDRPPREFQKDGWRTTNNQRLTNVGSPYCQLPSFWCEVSEVKWVSEWSEWSEWSDWIMKLFVWCWKCVKQVV